MPDNLPLQQLAEQLLADLEARMTRGGVSTIADATAMILSALRAVQRETLLNAVDDMERRLRSRAASLEGSTPPAAETE